MSVPSLLRTYAATKALTQGIRLHSQLKLDGSDCHTLVGNLLVNMYAQCGCLDQACLAFDRIAIRNVFSWNIFVTANAQCGHCNDAREVFDRMPNQNLVSWNAIIRAFIRNNELIQAREFFDRMPDRDIVSWNTMLAAYAHLGVIDRAAELFARIEHPDVVSLNTIISAYSQHGHASIALELLLLGGGAAKRDFVSWSTVLAGFTREEKIEQAVQVFGKIPQMDALAWREMIQVLSRHGRIDEARALFDDLPQRDITSWTAILHGYSRNGNLALSKEAFHRMPAHDDFSCTAILAAAEYSGTGDVGRALETFSLLRSRDPVCWTAMIRALSRNGRQEQAVALFIAMDVEGIGFDSVVFLAAMDACAAIPSLHRGRIIHGEIVEQGLDTNDSVRTAILDMYAKCGSLEMAREIFFRWNFRRDAVSWNALVAAHAANGASLESLRLFEMMIQDGVSPTDSSFVAALSACSHSGLVEVAQRHFVSIGSDFPGIGHSLELYMIVVDVLARAGRLDEAEELFEAMPFEPDAVTWRSVAAGCRVHGERIRAKQEHDQSSSYALFINIFFV